MAQETVTIKRTTLILTISLVVVFAIGLVGGIALSGYLSNTDSSPQPKTGGRIQVSLDDDAILGDANAKVVVVEFSDFQCPFCRRFYTQTLSQLKEEYVSTGKIKFVYRDFPLSSIHPAAEKSAEASECAEEQGKFWEYHDKIFMEQDKLGQGTIEYGIEELKKWASEIGLDENKFNQCLDSGKYTSLIQEDTSASSALGVQSTPTFLINGQAVVGAQPFEVFKQTIDPLLK